ncbi:BolA domain UV induced protein Uvi31 [Cryptotrichosporon argae]
MLSQRPPSLLKRFFLRLNRTYSTPAAPRPFARPSPSAASPIAGRTLSTTPRVQARMAARIPGPVETSIQTKLIDAFQPTLIRISNDSSKHAHHAPMRAINGGTGETHFAVAIVSPAFVGKSQIARHRLVNGLLKDEFEHMGLHALSLRLKTPDEWEREVDSAVAQATLATSSAVAPGPTRAALTDRPDRLPRFDAHGDRVWLSAQRAPTGRELVLSILLFPLFAFRQYRAGAADRAAATDAARLAVDDPTVVVPTGAWVAGPTTTSPCGTVAARLTRAGRLAEAGLGWARLSRAERVARIDGRAKYDARGRRVFLAFQHEHTALEMLGALLTAPLCVYRFFRSLGRAMGEAGQEGQGGAWSVEDMDDFTVVVPTGTPRYLEGELLDRRIQDEGMKAEKKRLD